MDRKLSREFLRATHRMPLIENFRARQHGAALRGEIQSARYEHASVVQERRRMARPRRLHVAHGRRETPTRRIKYLPCCERKQRLRLEEILSPCDEDFAVVEQC